MTIKRTIRFDIWCDDGRYCDGKGGTALLVKSKTEAVAAARALGWKMPHNGLAAQCPACKHRKRIPEWKANG